MVKSTQRKCLSNKLKIKSVNSLTFEIMKKLVPSILIFSVFFLACSQPQSEEQEIKKENGKTAVENFKTWENERFKDVKVEQVSENNYRVTGKAQVFEATLSYVVEDGHFELVKGFTTTDAGAPEFGNFDFTLTAEKKDPNTTLMLILFESSPEDGSRTHELFIPLTNEVVQ